jgi:pyruvate dehydrogenase E2 component (dihydrolipoamide acetyltransferase)
MAEVILMPRLSDTMTEGVIAAWHKKIGDPVKKGDVLADIETDKATMELESYKDGTLLHLGADKGGKIQVNDLLAIIGNPGEDISAHLSAQSSTGTKAAEPGAPAPATASAPPATQQAAPASPAMDLSKMEEVVLMPRLSDTMTEGVVASWHKNVGDPIKKGDVLADIETDKATMELESYKNGTLLFQGAKPGEKIAVNDLLAIIGEQGKVDVQAIVQAAKGGGHPQSAAAPAAAPGTPAQQAASAPAEEAAPDHASSNGRVKASPLARRLAQEKGIDLRQVHGSGDNGRIIKSDVDNFVPTQQASKPAQTGQPQQAATAQPVVFGQEGFTDLPVSQMRKVIARRLSESKFSAPHFYLMMEINMDNAMAARAQMNEVSEVKISFNDMVVKAAAMALRKHPAVNSSWMGDFVRQYKHINIGVAVAIEDGLIVPVVRFADQKTLSQIAAETKELSGKARNKKLQPNEFSGNTFTVSNLGMMDIEEFTAIINSPDSAIMAVGRIKEVVVRKGEGFGVSNVMKITLSCDHRSVDGAVGASFLQTFKKYLENPVTMLV